MDASAAINNPLSFFAYHYCTKDTTKFQQLFCQSEEKRTTDLRL